MAAGKPAPLDASWGCCRCKGACARTRCDYLAGLKGLAMGPWGDGCLLWGGVGGFGELESPKGSAKGTANPPLKKEEKQCLQLGFWSAYRTRISAAICWGVAASQLLSASQLEKKRDHPVFCNC